MRRPGSVAVIAISTLLLACADRNWQEAESEAWRTTAKPGRLKITVLDVESGQPVTDADYHALRFAFEKERVAPKFPMMVDGPARPGSENGVYRWELAEGWHQIRVNADGYRNAWTPVFRIDEGGETSLVIEMRKANRLRVTVLDESGEPIEDGGVSLRGDGYRGGMHIANGVGERLVPVDEITVIVGDDFLEEYAYQKVVVPLLPGIVNEATIRLRR